MEAERALDRLEDACIAMGRGALDLGRLGEEFRAGYEESKSRDEEEIVRVKELLEWLEKIEGIHREAKAERERKRAKEKEVREKRERQMERKREAEAVKNGLKALKSKKEDTEGKVWDANRKMYVEMANDEVDSWRDR